MRRKLIAGNWKMYKTVPEAVALVRRMASRQMRRWPAADD